MWGIPRCYRRHVNQSGQEASETDNGCDQPTFPRGKGIADDGDDAANQRHGATDAQRKQHQKEQDGEQLQSQRTCQ